MRSGDCEIANAVPHRLVDLGTGRRRAARRGGGNGAVRAVGMAHRGFDSLSEIRQRQTRVGSMRDTFDAAVRVPPHGRSTKPFHGERRGFTEMLHGGDVKFLQEEPGRRSSVAPGREEKPARAASMVSRRKATPLHLLACEERCGGKEQETAGAADGNPFLCRKPCAR